MVLVSMVCSDPRQSFDSTFLLFSGYTISLSDLIVYDPANPILLFMSCR